MSHICSITDATVLTTDERFLGMPHAREGWLRLAQNAAISRTWGDCFGYLLVATGRAEVMTDPVLSEWDTAALLPIIEEAGGIFTNWRGDRTWKGHSAIATNYALAIAARALLSEDRLAGYDLSVGLD